MSLFSERLISLRKEHDMTQEDLAKIIHRKRSTVSGYETEGKEPDIDTLFTLAKAFGVSTDYLLGFSADRTHHTVTVLYGDHRGFRKLLSALPSDLQELVARCFDSFYLLLSRDLQLSRPERLSVYADFFSSLCSLRADVRTQVEASSGSLDPLALSELMSAQSQLKYRASEYLDKLLQADMEIAFGLEEKSGSASPGESAM